MPESAPTVIDTYKLDSSGGSFGTIRLKGVVYAWYDINAYAGDQNGAAPFSLTGSMVAYGGDPASAPQPGAARASIQAQSVDIQYDPSYVAGLAAGGPFQLNIISWHEF